MHFIFCACSEGKTEDFFEKKRIAMFKIGVQFAKSYKDYLESCQNSLLAQKGLDAIANIIAAYEE